MSNSEASDRFRDAPELGGSDGTGGAESRALRCFRDRHGVLRAGLYGSETPAADDDWEHGDTLTDATDAAIARRTAGQQDQTGALLGIGYERLRAEAGAHGRVRVPENLVEWDVRVVGTGRRKHDPGSTIEVLATSRRAAIAVAILVLADKAAGALEGHTRDREDIAARHARRAPTTRTDQSSASNGSAGSGSVRSGSM